MFELGEKEQAEVERSTDRSAAVLGGSYLDSAITTFLERRLIYDPKAFESFFGLRGSCGAFVPKIEFAYLSGLITKDFREDLKVIAKVRNQFAHESDIDSFDHPVIAKHLDQRLKMLTVGIRLMEIHEGSPITRRRRFLSAVGEAGALLRDRVSRPTFDPTGF